MHTRQVPVADLQALSAQDKVIQAQKWLKEIEFAQNTRSTKAQHAINFLLLPHQTKDGVIRNEPEYDDVEVRPHVVKSRCAAYDFLGRYFSTTTDFEKGVAVHEADIVDRDFLTA